MIITEYKESTGYKRIFECAKNNGIEETLNLFSQMEELKRLDLVTSAVLGGIHETLSLVKNKKGVIQFLRKYKLDIRSIFSNYEIITNALKLANNNPRILETYIENMRMLEELKVDRVEITKLRELLNRYYYFEMCRLSQTRAMITRKYYTDGQFDFHDRNAKINGCEVRWLFELSNGPKSTPTYLLNVDRRKSLENRTIEITGFDFNGKSLPTEEELSSNEIPSVLKLK